MKFTSMLALGALTAASLGAQSSQCLSQPVVARDACQRGTDLFLMLAPQLSGAIAGGGAVLGTARTVNGFSLAVRLNVVEGQLPDRSVLAFSTTGIVQSTISTRRAPIPVPTLDATLSLIPGFTVGRQKILSVDALVNMTYVPTSNLEDFSVGPAKSAVKAGYGTRVGLLADTRFTPAVSVSYVRRTLPTSNIATSVPINAAGSSQRDSMTLSELSLRTDATRLSISKRLGFLEIGGGAGQDRYRGFSQLRTRVTTVVFGAPRVPVESAYVVTQELVRSSAYASLGLTVGRVQLGAEAGSTFGGDSVQTYNRFADGKLSASRRFGSAGLRVRF